MTPKSKVVFLGTPAVALPVFKALANAAEHVHVLAVVSQPPARAPRGGGLVPSPVHQAALDAGIPVLCPETAKDPEFLEQLAQLAPDVCVTAAYGNILPDAFLAIPRRGTLNVHPSLLPAFRGAAPVQRAVEAGLDVSGVTVALTVKAMDAGPIVAQKTWPIAPEIKAPELLVTLFELGAQLLVRCLPDFVAGRLPVREQDHGQATKAPKIAPEEGWLDFSRGAKACHDRVRAFAGWPGTRTKLRVDREVVDTKIVTTRIVPQGAVLGVPVGDVFLTASGFAVTCGDGAFLEILELQPAGKRILSAKEFLNGTKGKPIFLSVGMESESHGGGQ